MCDIVQAYAAKSYDKGKSDGRTEGMNEGINIGIVQTLLNLVTEGIITLDFAIEDSGLKHDEFYSIARYLGSNI